MLGIKAPVLRLAHRITCSRTLSIVCGAFLRSAPSNHCQVAKYIYRHVILRAQNAAFGNTGRLRKHCDCPQQPPRKGRMARTPDLGCARRPPHQAGGPLWRGPPQAASNVCPRQRSRSSLRCMSLPVAASSHMPWMAQPQKRRPPSTAPAAEQMGRITWSAAHVCPIVN